MGRDKSITYKWMEIPMGTPLPFPGIILTRGDKAQEICRILSAGERSRSEYGFYDKGTSYPFSTWLIYEAPEPVINDWGEVSL